MFIINITVNTDVSEKKHNELFPSHVKWLEQYCHSGIFLLSGPYIDVAGHTGVIIAQANSREELETVLKEDGYYPAFAQYDVREFTPKFVAEHISHAVK